MSPSAIGLAIYLVLLVAFFSAMTWWIVYSRRHPEVPAPWWVSATVSLLRIVAEIVRALAGALLLMVVILLLLSWASPGLIEQLQPSDRYAVGLLYITLTVIVFGALRWQLFIINVSLRRVANELGLSWKARATGYATNWWRTYLQPRQLAGMSTADLNDPALMANPCAALYQKDDPYRLLVVSYGLYPGILRREKRSVVWVCLYICDPERGGPAISVDAQQRLRAMNFDVQLRPGYVRICDQRDCIVTRPLREATDPKRIAELWRETEPRRAP